MSKKKFTEEQIINILKEAETGGKVDDLCRRHGTSDATYYRWQAKDVNLQQKWASYRT